MPVKITVEGTPEECDALRNILTGAAKAGDKVEIELTVIETVTVPPPKVPLVLINGGLSDRKQRAIELPKLN